MVGVRSAWNTTGADRWAAKPFSIQVPVSSATLTPNVAAPQAAGSTIVWTASATGGQAPYQYQFVVYDGTGWTITRPWAASNTYAWTPTVGDPDYQVIAQVRSAWNPGDREVAVAKPFPINAVVTNVTLTPSVASPQSSGTTIRWQASVTGGQGPYRYQWVVFNGTTWTNLTGGTTSSTFDWRPTAANAGYRFAVRVWSAWNTGSTADFTAFYNYAITAPLSASTAVFEPASPSGSVSYYRLEVFAAGANISAAAPIATQNLGQPPVVAGEARADVRATLLPLPLGSYDVTVAAVGSFGVLRSQPFRFVR
jgi:hypothetical protein